MVLLGDDEFFRTGATVRSVSDDVLLAAIEEVVLPKVSSIGSGAFNYCTNLKKLDIGGVVTKIKTDLILVKSISRFSRNTVDMLETIRSLINILITETYIIFITGNDVLKAGLPIYNIERVILQTQTQFGDKAHIVYVNGTYRGEDPVGELMSDFHCSDYREMKNKTLANMVQYYKEDPKGVDKMCELMDRIAESRAVEARIQNALEMIADGLPLEKIAKYSGLSLEKVKELADKRSA